MRDLATLALQRVVPLSLSLLPYESLGPLLAPRPARAAGGGWEVWGAAGGDVAVWGWAGEGREGVGPPRAPTAAACAVRLLESGTPSSPAMRAVAALSKTARRLARRRWAALAAAAARAAAALRRGVGAGVRRGAGAGAPWRGRPARPAAALSVAGDAGAARGGRAAGIVRLERVRARLQRIVRVQALSLE